MTPLASDYEIRLARPDGSTSIVMKVTAVSDLDAKSQATAMLTETISNAHIWRDGRHVESVYRKH
jgi:hypothetical protein